MSRPLRIERAGGWYHLTARGNERRPIFRDGGDRAHFCELLGQMVGQFRVGLHAFVLMDNHYHLIVELTEPNLSRTGQWLNVSYSVWFNRRHGRSGHLLSPIVAIS
jgi:REP element-mobilizing transposase RayT